MISMSDNYVADTLLGTYMCAVATVNPPPVASNLPETSFLTLNYLCCMYCVVFTAAFLARNWKKQFKVENVFAFGM
jgi:hypothetical protein